MNVQNEQFKILIRNLRKQSEQTKLGIKRIDDSNTSRKKSKEISIQEEYKHNKE